MSCSYVFYKRTFSIGKALQLDSIPRQSPLMNFRYVSSSAILSFSRQSSHTDVTVSLIAYNSISKSENSSFNRDTYSRKYTVEAALSHHMFFQ
jgi:hypothetical protein